MHNAGFIRATPKRQAIYATGASMSRNWPRLVGRMLVIARDPIPLSLVLGMTVLGVPPSGIIVRAHAQPRDPVVTSDSPEYCDELMNLIAGLTHAAAVPPPTEAAELSEEGERMCGHGQTRGGVLRLRRALLIIRRGED